MSEASRIIVEGAAWLTAAALALAVGAGAAALAWWRRAREAERRLRALENAVAAFSSALRRRLACERSRVLSATARHAPTSEGRGPGGQAPDGFDPHAPAGSPGHASGSIPWASSSSDSPSSSSRVGSGSPGVAGQQRPSA